MKHIRHTALAFCLLSAILIADDSIVQIQYTGQLKSLPRGSAAVTVKEFSITCTLPTDAEQSVDETAFVVVQESTPTLPKVEQFQAISSRSPLDTHRAAIAYEHLGRNYVLPISLPYFSEHDKLGPDAAWKSDNIRYEVVGEESVAGHSCWKVRFQLQPVRTQELLVRKDRPLVVAGTQTVFMGQGDKFELSFTAGTPETLSPEASGEILKAQAALLSTQSELQRSANNRPAPLSTPQVEIALKHSPALEELSAGTNLEDFVAALLKEVRQQSQRKVRVGDVATRLMNHPAPKFTLTQLNGSALPAEELADQVVVLHFWDYQDAPLEQPYGQIGYLDFLQSRWADKGVKVFGVAVNSQIANPETRSEGVRSIKKLTQFMKLGYPITYDAGAALNAFGNPTRLGEDLPLWVVINNDGTVALYQTGYFTIDNQRGLKELDETIEKLAQ